MHPFTDLIVLLGLASASRAAQTNEYSKDIGRCRGILGGMWGVEEFCSEWLHVYPQTRYVTRTVKSGATTTTK